MHVHICMYHTKHFSNYLLVFNILKISYPQKCEIDLVSVDCRLTNWYLTSFNRIMTTRPSVGDGDKVL